MTSTTSPLTNFSAGIWVNFPSLRHLVTEGSIFLKLSIKAYDWDCCKKVIIPVIKMTIIKTKARYRFGKFPNGWTMYVIIHKMDPTHNIMANQLVISFKNRIQAGVFSFSGNLLSPYCKFLADAPDVVIPFSIEVPNLCNNSSIGILCSSICWILDAFPSAFLAYNSFSFFGFSI